MAKDDYRSLYDYMKKRSFDRMLDETAEEFLEWRKKNGRKTT